MKTLYVYRTHVWNEFCQVQFKLLQKDLGPENVYLLYDDTKNKFPESNCKRWSDSDSHSETTHYIMTNFDECLSINPLHRSNKEQIESQLLLLYKLCNTEFNYIWLIEYDVFCDGNWREALKSCDLLSTDFLASKVYTYHESPLWNHWFRIYGPRRNKPMLSDRVGSFFPLVRISRLLIQALQKNINIYTGFCEVYIPTVAKQYSLTFASFPTSIVSDCFFFDPLKADCKSPLPLKYNNILYHPVLQFTQRGEEDKNA